MLVMSLTVLTQPLLVSPLLDRHASYWSSAGMVSPYMPALITTHFTRGSLS